VQVWDVLKGEGLVNYRGHGNRVMCVEWSPLDPDMVWTGADDFTVHEWRPSRQEHTAPPRGKEDRPVLVGLQTGPSRTTDWSWWVYRPDPVGLQTGLGGSTDRTRWVYRPFLVSLQTGPGVSTDRTR